jgi:hypothetical protein
MRVAQALEANNKFIDIGLTRHGQKFASLLPFPFHSFSSHLKSKLLKDGLKIHHE